MAEVIGSCPIAYTKSLLRGLMARYPTNHKGKLDRILSAYLPGTKFKLANGSVISLCSPYGHDGRATCRIHDAVVSLHDCGSMGIWEADGTKVFPEDWPARMEIVEVL